MTDQTAGEHDETGKAAADISPGPSWIARCREQVRQFIRGATPLSDMAGCCGPTGCPPGNDDD